MRERRNQVRRTGYAAPELLATSPNQLWSWDITKLRGPSAWTYYYLYVILDVFSRCVVGWLLAEREDAELAEALIAESCSKQAIQPGQLTLHADRGSAMTSKTVAQLLSDLGVLKTHSRPYVSNDIYSTFAALRAQIPAGLNIAFGIWQRFVHFGATVFMQGERW